MTRPTRKLERKNIFGRFLFCIFLPIRFTVPYTIPKRVTILFSTLGEKIFVIFKTTESLLKSSVQIQKQISPAFTLEIIIKCPALMHALLFDLTSNRSFFIQSATLSHRTVYTSTRQTSNGILRYLNESDIEHRIFRTSRLRPFWAIIQNPPRKTSRVDNELLFFRVWNTAHYPFIQRITLIH